MIKNTYTEELWLVCHDGTKCHAFCHINASHEHPQTFSSGQSNVEEFQNEEDAIARAKELGWTFPE